MNAWPPSIPDSLDAEIAAKAAAEADLVHRLDVLRIELKTLRYAAELRPAKQMSAVQSTIEPRLSADQSHSTAEKTRASVAHFLNGGLLGVETERRRMGKEKGSVGKNWLIVMKYMVKAGNEFLTYDSWAIAALECGVSISETAARDWLHRGVGRQQGYIEHQGRAYRVSQLAIDKFGLKEPLPSESSGSDSPTETGG